MIRIGECLEHFTVTGQSSHSLAVSEKEKINIGVNSQHCMTGNRSIIPKRKSSFGENFTCMGNFFCRFLLSLFQTYKFTENNYPYYGLEKTSVKFSCIFILVDKTSSLRSDCYAWLQHAATSPKLTICIVEVGKNLFFF